MDRRSRECRAARSEHGRCDDGVAVDRPDGDVDTLLHPRLDDVRLATGITSLLCIAIGIWADQFFQERWYNGRTTALQVAQCTKADSHESLSRAPTHAGQADQGRGRSD